MKKTKIFDDKLNRADMKFVFFYCIFYICIVRMSIDGAILAAKFEYANL